MFIYIHPNILVLTLKVIIIIAILVAIYKIIEIYVNQPPKKPAIEISWTKLSIVIFLTSIIFIGFILTLYFYKYDGQLYFNSIERKNGIKIISNKPGQYLKKYYSQ